MILEGVVLCGSMHRYVHHHNNNNSVRKPVEVTDRSDFSFVWAFCSFHLISILSSLEGEKGLFKQFSAKATMGLCLSE